MNDKQPLAGAEASALPPQHFAALIEASEFAAGAILDAISLEDGLDGEAGARVLHMLRSALAGVGRPLFDGVWPPPEDQPMAYPRIQEAVCHDYLSRLLVACAPQCEPLPTLMGVCTQVDNYIAGLHQRLAEASALPQLQAIRTADRLPEDGQRVFIWLPSYLGGYWRETRFLDLRMPGPSFEGYYGPWPTWWLPQPPDPGLAEASARPPHQPLIQILKDLVQIHSSHGYLLMRLSVAKDAQDAFDVCKQAFRDAEDALKRLESSVPGWLHTHRDADVAKWLAPLVGGEASARPPQHTALVAELRARRDPAGCTQEPINGARIDCRTWHVGRPYTRWCRSCVLEEAAVALEASARPSPPLCSGCRQPMQRVSYRCGQCQTFIAGDARPSPPDRPKDDERSDALANGVEGSEHGDLRENLNGKAASDG